MKDLEQKNNELEKKVELLQKYCDYLIESVDYNILNDYDIEWLPYDEWYDATFQPVINGLSPGDVFKLNESDEIKWVVLEQQQDGVLCLMKDCLKDKMPFNKNKAGDWKLSSLRDYLNNDWVKENIKEDIIVLFERDLMRDDGTNKGENSTDYVSSLTCDEHRKYIEFIPKVNTWYWTITSWCASDSSRVRNVIGSGALGHNSADNYGGVRPCVKFKPSLKVYRV